jgi:hypothetical protein
MSRLGIPIVLIIAGCASDDADKTNTDAASCTPTTCIAAGKNCGSMPDGCGGVLQCGSCTGSDVCGGGGVSNVCGAGSCTPTTCAAEGKNCGTISDGCGDVLSCGSCTGPETCGGGGVANVCGSGPDKDAGSPGPDGSSGPCDPACMAQSGAVCCTACGCEGEVCRSATRRTCGTARSSAASTTMARGANSARSGACSALVRLLQATSA